MPQTDPDISIIIVSYNANDCLYNCLLRLEQAKNSSFFEIIVVDNDSKDGSADMVHAQFPDIKLIKNLNNDGFGAANNLGAEKAIGKFLVFLNPDAFLTPNALSLALQKMKENPKIGIGGARLTDLQGRHQPSARSFPSVADDLFLLSGLADRYSKARSSKDQSGEVDWITGAFMIISKALFRKAEGFDERFFLYYEEVDLCRKVKDLGYQVWYWPDVAVQHIGGISSEQISAKRTMWRMRSALLYYRKYHGFLGAYFLKQMEQNWHRLRILRNRLFPTAASPQKIEESALIIHLMDQAWKDTHGGTTSPSKPW